MIKFTIMVFLTFTHEISQLRSSTLVYRIDVHARLLTLRKNFPLHGLILVCTFIDFEKTLPPVRIFHPARLLVSYLLTFIFQS